jgi:hypothetical protein
MRTLPLNASDNAIREIVVEWSELLAKKRYAEALEMCPPAPEAQAEWTPAELGAWITNYGSPDAIPGEPTHVLTSLLDRDDAQDIIQNKIDVDRNNLYGLDAGKYLGMVHYGDVPLDGERSDLTARFHIKKIGDDRMALEFLDIHVM